VFDRTQARRIEKNIKDRAKQLVEQKHITIDQYLVNTLCQRALLIQLKRQQHCLVHGDLYCRHLLYQNGVLTAIIDWGDVGINHPAVDLAALYSIFPRAAHATFYSVYGDIDEDSKNYAQFLALHSILAVFDYAINHQDQALEKESIEALERLRELIH